MGEVEGMRCPICEAVENLKRCTACKSVAYCGKEHQVEHWPVHKMTCGVPWSLSLAPKKRDLYRALQLPDWRTIQIQAEERDLILRTGDVPPVPLCFGLRLAVKVAQPEGLDTGGENQPATYLMIEVRDGLARGKYGGGWMHPSGQFRFVGPVLVVWRDGDGDYTPDRHDRLHQFLAELLDRYSEGPGAVVPERDLTYARWAAFVARYERCPPGSPLCGTCGGAIKDPNAGCARCRRGPADD